MKTLFYSLTIGGLLWLFFNPNGILTYNSKSNEVRKLNKEQKKHKSERDENKKKFDWLKALIRDIDNKDLEKQKHILEKHGSQIGAELISRNFFIKYFEALKIIKKDP